MPITHCSTFSQELPLFLLHCLRDLGLKPKRRLRPPSLKRLSKNPCFGSYVNLPQTGAWSTLRKPIRPTPRRGLTSKPSLPGQPPPQRGLAAQEGIPQTVVPGHSPALTSQRGPELRVAQNLSLKLRSSRLHVCNPCRRTHIYIYKYIYTHMYIYIYRDMLY